MSHPWRHAAAALAVAAGAAQAQPAPGWAFSLRSDHHADALALQDFGDGAEERLAPRAGTNLGWVDDEARASRREGAWTWSLLARSRATVVATQDALDLVAQVAQRRPPQGDRRWHVDAHYRSFTGGGLALARGWEPASGWQIDGEAQVLALRHWRERRIAGQVQQRQADGGYAFALRSQALDDRLDFPFQAEAASRGSGLLFSVAAAWRAGDWHARAAVHDVGWLRWQRVPQQDAVLDTATAALDADGLLIYQPLIQGQNSQASRTRRAAPHALFTAGWQAMARTELTAGAAWLPGHAPLPRLGVRQALAGDWHVGAEWRVHERRLGLQASWRGWQLEAGADKLGSGARSRAIALSYGLAL